MKKNDFISIDDLIATIKEVDKNSNAWIFDDDGNIKDDAIVADVINVLTDIGNADLEVTDEDELNKIFYLMDDDEIECDDDIYTYNYNAPLSHDIVLKQYEIDEQIYTLLMVHVGSDARVGFTDAVVLNGTIETVVESCYYQTKQLTNDLSIDFNVFDECYDVYSIKRNDSIYTGYETELKDLLVAIIEELMS